MSKYEIVNKENFAIHIGADVINNEDNIRKLMTFESLIELLNAKDKALELCCKALNKELGNNKCKYCSYEFLNDDYFGSCDCDEQFETERTMRYFEDKVKEVE